jgi:hypothetical protein
VLEAAVKSVGIQMILYFVEVQLVFAVVVALQCVLVLALAGIYVSL